MLSKVTLQAKVASLLALLPLFVVSCGIRDISPVTSIPTHNIAIFSVPTNTAPPSPITLLPGGKIAVVEIGNSLLDERITIIDVASGQSVEVITGCIFCSSSLSWSPNGQQIAFQGAFKPMENVDVYTVSINGGHQVQRVTNPPYSKAFVTWSPSGNQIAYMLEGDPTDIAIVDLKTGNTHKITDTLEYESHPAWSPDGEYIAFLYRVERGSESVELWRMDTNGGSRTKITDIPVILSTPAWSPDGRQIAFISTDSAKYCGDIYIVDINGDNLRRLTDLAGCAESPTWSPDGRYIAFAGSDKRDKDIITMGWQIYIISIDGKYLKQITAGDNWVRVSPVWSPTLHP